MSRRFASHDIVFGIGPAGTGKTYLAMAMALSALMKNQVTRMVLCRPAVEAGEKLGFLPGDLAEKVNPYLRPLYDALHDMVDYDRARRMLERGTIEVAPLAFMRGRTLNDSFIILDEAQNTTSEQMKMFLTRLGYGSKAVITGDITQIDLPSGKLSGLKEARTVLAETPGISFVHFNERDVVRHRLVQAVITAYESFSGDRTLPFRCRCPTRNLQAAAESVPVAMPVAIICRSASARRMSAGCARTAYALLRILGLEHCELSLVMVGDRAIRRLNRDFRAKDQATDVLSFPQFEGKAELKALARGAAKDAPPIPTRRHRDIDRDRVAAGARTRAERGGASAHVADSWAVAFDGLRS